MAGNKDEHIWVKLGERKKWENITVKHLLCDYND